MTIEELKSNLTEKLLAMLPKNMAKDVTREDAMANLAEALAEPIDEAVLDVQSYDWKGMASVAEICTKQEPKRGDVWGVTDGGTIVWPGAEPMEVEKGDIVVYNGSGWKMFLHIDPAVVDCYTKAETDERIAAAVNAEANARQAADNALSTAITAEATARANADTALGERIDSEASARASADDALDARLTTAEGDIDTLETAVDALYNSEVSGATDEIAVSSSTSGKVKTFVVSLANVIKTKINAAYNHISDTVKHITASERANWNTAYTHSQTDGNPHGTTIEDINGLRNELSEIESDVEAVEAVIPSEASASNQLADKAFVNSSITSNTATFRGTSAAGLTETQFLAWANTLTKTNNDYVFWNTTDASGNILFKRYKYNGSNWIYEFSLNNSSFTAAQWAAINSGIAESDVDDIAYNTAARHTHSNKNLLDSYTQSNANLADAVSKKHSHSNKSVLDNTTASFTTANETKLDSIEAGANKTVVDTALSDTSANPVQNNAVKTALDAKANADGSNATGTWPIGITGNAATATSAGSISIEEIGTTTVDLNDYRANDGRVHFYAWSNRNKGNVQNKPTDDVYTVEVSVQGAGSTGIYVVQKAYRRGTDDIYVRRKSDSTQAPWTSWKRVVYGDGSNATGTWPIGITGNAATATKAESRTFETNPASNAASSALYADNPADTSKKIGVFFNRNGHRGLWDTQKQQLVVDIDPDGNAKFNGNAATASALSIPSNIGNNTTPIFYDSRTGQFAVCTPSSMSVGSASTATTATTAQKLQVNSAVGRPLRPCYITSTGVPAACDVEFAFYD